MTQAHYPFLDPQVPILPLFLRESTRSCVAQAGGFIRFANNNHPNHVLSKSDFDILQHGGTIHVPHLLANIGPNDLIFAVGDRIVRPFYTNPHFMLVGDQLIAQVANGLI